MGYVNSLIIFLDLAHEGPVKEGNCSPSQWNPANTEGSH